MTGAWDISVVIPTWNRATQVLEAVESVVNQTVRAKEIIVVDDGSTDDTRGVVADYIQARGEPSVVSIVGLPDQRGVSAARNVGIRRASGHWIALLDSDDRWLPSKLERQIEALARDGTGFCHTEEIWIRRGRRVNPMNKHKKYHGSIYRRCLPLCAISPSSVLIRRSVFDELGLFDEDLIACEDYDYWLRYCSRYPVTLIDEPLVVKYGGHPDQLSRTTVGLDRFRIRALEKILAEGHLSAADRLATLQMLVTKCRIYGHGARKRGRIDEANTLEDKRIWATDQCTLLMDAAS